MMKHILTLLIMLVTFGFSQVPDSVIVNKLATIVTEFNKNKEIIEQYQARQQYLLASHNTLSELIKEKELKEESDDKEDQNDKE